MDNENIDFNFDDYIVYDGGVSDDELDYTNEYENKVKYFVHMLQLLQIYKKVLMFFQCIGVILDSIKNSGGNIVAIENNPGLILKNGTIHESRSMYDEISSTQFFAASSKVITFSSFINHRHRQDGTLTFLVLYLRYVKDTPIFRDHINDP